MGEENKKQKILWLMLSIFIAAVYVVFGRMRYLEPEDYVFTGTLAGVSGFDDLQYFLHPYYSVILSRILATIANITGIFNIYAVFILSVYVAVFVAVHLLATKCKEPDIIHLAAIIFQCLLARYLTYTSIAYLAVGVFMIYVYVRPERKLVLEDLLFVILALCGILMRGEILITTFLMLSPCLLKPIFESKKKRTASVTAIIILAVVYLSTQSYNNAVYHADDVWSKYYDWNVASTNIRDFAAIDYEAYRETFLDIGWSSNDLALVSSWKFIDLNTFSEDNLEKVASAVSINDRYELNPFKLAYGMIGQKTSLIMLVSALFIILSQKRPRRIKEWVWNLAACIIPLGLMGALFLRQRYVERIAVPILILGLLQMLFLIKPNSSRKNRALRFTALILCCSLLLIAEMRFVKQTEGNPHEELSEYLHSTEDILFITNSGLANELLCSNAIINISVRDYYPNVLKMGSWDSYTKRYYNQISKFGIKDPDNMFYALATEENVRLLTYEPKDCVALERYLLEHYSLRGRFVEEQRFEDGSTVYAWENYGKL